MKSPKSSIVIVAGFTIALTLQGCQGCKTHSDQTSTTPQAVASSSLKQTRIITKLPDFVSAWNGAKSEDGLLARYSPQYAAIYQSIAVKTNSIADPQLRAMAISDAWRPFDNETRVSWLSEAKANFTQYQSKFFSDNADMLFEIGRIEPTTGSDNTCNPDSRDGFTWVYDAGGNRLLELCRSDTPFLYNRIALKISVPDLDNIQRRFDSLSASDVQACVNALYAQNRDLVEKEIQESGMPRNEAMAQAMEEGRQSCLPEVRDNLRVMAQGNLLLKQITKVFIMDYQTEDVLAELSPTAIVGLDDAGLGWATPTTDGTCKTGAPVIQNCN